jgi:outer membrane receptor for ferrienterochelin and colicins
VDEVVVTGQYKAIKADKSIYKVDVINNTQIKSKAANNLAELLSTELNLRTSMDASLGTNISIQGLSGEHVKILVDGIPVIGRQSGILDLSQVVLSNVDHIEIVEGPMSVIYGSNA